MTSIVEYAGERAIALPSTKDSPSCVQSKLKRPVCGICSKMCPAGAITSFGGNVIINATACLGCGTCAAMCPSGHIVDRGRQVDCVLEHNAAKPRNLVIHCSAVPQAALPLKADEGDSSVQVKCLSSLPWEVYALCAHRGPTTVVRGFCPDCESGHLEARVKAQSACAKRTCQSAGMAQNLRFAKATSMNFANGACSAESESTSRRGFLTWVKRQMKAEVALAVDEVMPTKPNRLLRERLFQKIARTQYGDLSDPVGEQTVSWPLPKRNESCIACGICAQLCPSKALCIESVSGKGLVCQLMVQRCTGCTLCVRACPHKAIAYPSYRDVSPGASVITEVLTTETCDICGGFSAMLREFDGERLCSNCMARVRANGGRKPDSTQRKMIARARMKRVLGSQGR